MTYLPCPSPLPAPCAYDCLHRRSTRCRWNLCYFCCVNSAKRLTEFEACSCSSHEVFENDSPIFSFDIDDPQRSYYDWSTLPIVSPLCGNFTLPAGRAWLDLLGPDGVAYGSALKDDALSRYTNEGITLFVFIWSKASLKTFNMLSS